MPDCCAWGIDRSVCECSHLSNWRLCAAAAFLQAGTLATLGGQPAGTTLPCLPGFLKQLKQMAGSVEVEALLRPFKRQKGTDGKMQLAGQTITLEQSGIKLRLPLPATMLGAGPRRNSIKVRCSSLCTPTHPAGWWCASRLGPSIVHADLFF